MDTICSSENWCCFIPLSSSCWLLFALSSPRRPTLPLVRLSGGASFAPFAAHLVDLRHRFRQGSLAGSMLFVHLDQLHWDLPPCSVATEQYAGQVSPRCT